MQTIEESLRRYLDIKKMYHFEGSGGVERLEKVITEVCGYDNAWAGTLQNFFADNSGAIEAVIEWIGNQKCAEWKEHLEDMVGPDEEDEVGDLVPPEETLAGDPRDFMIRDYK